MGKYDKLRLRILSGEADAAINVAALCQLLVRLGFSDRIKGGRVTTQRDARTGDAMHDCIAVKRHDIAFVCRRFGVVRLEVFGSAARGDDFVDATSDADFLVDLAPRSDLSALEQFFGLKEALEAVLERPVDLVEQSAVLVFMPA